VFAITLDLLQLINRRYFVSLGYFFAGIIAHLRNTTLMTNKGNKLKTLKILWLVMIVLPIHAMATELVTDQVRLSNAWVKQPMPGMQMSVGFVDIENTTTKALRLIAVRSPFSMKSELHEMVMVDNVMQMRHADDGWVIAPGASISLAPGGKHVMLMGVKSYEQDQTQTQLEFHIENMGWVSVAASLKVSMP
jgi:copper(I)-binding protein|tara:strand:- start:140 stop:715 length:576 start_codon:yes stop_codon:yes gene_type:complete